MIAAPEPRRLEPVRSAVAEVAADVSLLLRRGRVAPALAQLERLPKLVRVELADRVGAAYRQGYLDGQQALAAQITGTAAKPRRRQPTRLDWLRQKAAVPELRAGAVVALRLDERAFDRLLAGGCTLSSGQWKRLRAELGP
jgi:hypothetical protein